MKKPIFLLLAALLLCSAKKNEIVWVAIGDSITYLNDHPDETGNRLNKGYLTRVVNGLPNLRYVNQGHNGWQAHNIADSINRLGIIKADVYSVFLGTNDWWGGLPLGSIDDYKNNTGSGSLYGSFRIIINKLRSLNPDAKLVLITPMQRGDFVYILGHSNNAYGSYKAKNGQSLESFANAVAAIGKLENIPVVDLYHNPQLDVKNAVHFKRLKDPKTGSYTNYPYPKFIGIPYNPQTDEYPYPPEAINVTYDGLHPSDKGAAIIANQVIKQFKQLGLAPDWDKYISLKQYAEPFWKADTIIDERIQLIKNGALTDAPLLFPAKKILSVHATDGSKTYVQGKDWKYLNGKIVAIKGATLPFLHKDSLLFTQNVPGRSMAGSKPGTFVLFKEDAYLPQHQLSVTYIPEKTHQWNGPVSVYNENALPLTIEKLKAGKELTILYYGDSIEVGYNASGLIGTPPYMPTWAEQVTYNLRNTYRSMINYVNTSVSGQMSKWGLDSVATRVVAHHPDLVVIGFGMNDGSFKLAPKKFREQIKGIMDAVLAANPKAEFILVSPTLANPDAIQAGLQAEYKAELQQLLKPGVALADMTGVHAELLKHKRFQDMTGNDVNHPNDYLVRWYAQMVSGLLIK